VNRRARRLSDGARLRRPDDAADLEGPVLAGHTAADRAGAGEHRLGEGLVDDGELRAGRGGGEVLPGDERDPEDVEEAGSDGIDIGVRRRTGAVGARLRGPE